MITLGSQFLCDKVEFDNYFWFPEKETDKLMQTLVELS